MNESDLQALASKLCPLYPSIGLMVESARDGVFRCRVPFNPQNGNHIGTIHAALQWTAAEALGGIMILSMFKPEQFATLYGAARSVTVEFLRPARTEITAEARLEPEECERIRTLIESGQEARFDLRAVVRDANGETVATMQALYIVRTRRTGAA